MKMKRMTTVGRGKMLVNLKTSPVCCSRLVTLKDLVCVRNHRALFASLSLQLSAGQGLLIRGENGAGKSTLLHTLAGILPAAEGHYDLQDFQYIAQGFTLKSHESPYQHLTTWSELWGGDLSLIESSLKAWGIDDPHRPAHSYSVGQRKRVILARLSLVSKRVWLLDEPTSALDDHGKAILKTLVEDHLRTGGCVIACTHDALNWQGCSEMTLEAP